MDKHDDQDPGLLGLKILEYVYIFFYFQPFLSLPITETTTETEEIWISVRT